MTKLAISEAPPVDQGLAAAPEPIALLQLAAHGYRNALSDAVSAIYREYRAGRRVVAVIRSDGRSIDALLARLDAVGVPTHDLGDAAAGLAQTVTIVRGSEGPPASAPVRGQAVRVAVAGFGIVGGGLVDRLLTDERFEVVGVLVRDLVRPREVQLDPRLLLTDAGALLAREPDILVDATSDTALSLSLVRAALARGIDVVSANKQAIVSDQGGLHSLAETSGARLLYSAAVGGGVPMLELIDRARLIGGLTHIEGVLNGTTNYVLSRMDVGAGFAQAVAAARKAGFAEEDPSADLDGSDAAAKLSLLSFRAGRPISFGRVCRTPLGESPHRGARQVAAGDLTTRQGEVTVRSSAHGAYSTLQNEGCGLRVTFADGRVWETRGRGAGRHPTCESVWADICDLL